MQKHHQIHQDHNLQQIDKQFQCALNSTFHECPEQYCSNISNNFQLNIIKLYEVPMTASKKVFNRNHNYQYQRNTLSSNYKKRQSNKSYNQMITNKNYANYEQKNQIINIKNINKNYQDRKLTSSQSKQMNYARLKSDKGNSLATNSIGLKKQDLRNIIFNQHKNTRQIQNEQSKQEYNVIKYQIQQKNILRSKSKNKQHNNWRSSSKEDNFRNTINFLKNTYVNKKSQNGKINHMLPQLKKIISKTSTKQEKNNQKYESIIKDQDLLNINQFLQKERNRVKSSSKSSSHSTKNTESKKQQKIKFEVNNKQQNNGNIIQKLKFRIKKQTKDIKVTK